MRFFLLLVFSGSTLWAQPVRPQVSVEFLKETLSYLASDAMKGRDTPSPELDEAAAYIAARFTEWKLAPAYGESFFDGPRKADPSLAKAVLYSGDTSLPLSAEQFIVAGNAEANGDRLPILAWTFGDDAGVLPSEEQATGRVILLKDPPMGPDDDRRGWFWRRLISRLADRGARAVLVPGDQPKSLPAASVTIPVLRLASGTSLGKDVERGEIDGASLALTLPLNKLPFASNVGAILRGSDPKLRDEYIVFSAHYDHIGVGRAVAGDSIYNGADDNGTGTTSVMAIAKAMSQLPVAPKRSVLFLLFYGEEKGLMGSRYYCEHPAVPLAKTMAVFNIEMVGRPDDIKPSTAWVTGWTESDFGPLIAESGKSAGVEFYERKPLSRRLFTQSDNLPFAQRGIPAHSISAGSLHADYHRPSDEVKKIDFANMARVVTGLLAAGHAMADGGKVPTWSTESQFAKQDPRQK